MATFDSSHASRSKRRSESFSRHASPPEKKVKLLDESDASDDTDSDQSESFLRVSNGFGINEKYAKRFEHNKKREELDRCA